MIVPNCVLKSFLSNTPHQYLEFFSPSWVFHNALTHFFLPFSRMNSFPMHVLLVLRVEPLRAVVAPVQILTGVMDRYVFLLNLENRPIRYDRSTL